MADTEAIRAAESWFDAHGLPYFVESREGSVRAALSPGRLISLGWLGLLLSVAAGVGVWIVLHDWAAGLFVGTALPIAIVIGYALLALRVAPIARWAGRQAISGLGLMFSLVTRALPMLLLVLTFLFINTEVWQVASTMNRALLWVTVLLFAGLAVGFLVAHVPDEMDRVKGETSGSGLVIACRDTPLQGAAEQVYKNATQQPLTLQQRANLVLVLLIAQTIQVVLLALAVFAFFVVFGRIAISDTVILLWTGHHATYLGSINLISSELFQVSIFLSAFAGLYFTVYAVTDQTYRDRFFSQIATDLKRAIAVHTVYRNLLRVPAD
jgi:hypothetical protein